MTLFLTGVGTRTGGDAHADAHCDAAAGSRQIPALDGIRGLAIIWVVLHNATGIPLTLPASRWLHLFPLLASRGWIGVQLFFALSGFLITAGLLDSQRTAHYFRNFYAKRALRILPLYYAVLFALLVVLPHLITPRSHYSREDQAALWLFVLNWTNLQPYGFGHFWSLAVEEQFYLFWPLVVCWLPPRRLLLVCVGISAGALVLRCVLAACGADPHTLYANTACRMDALALGGAGACLLRIPALRQQLLSRLRLIGTLALVLFLAGVPLTHIYDTDRWTGETFGYTLLAVCSATLVTAMAVLPGARARVGIAAALALAPLRSCGKYSYAMYVFHNPLHWYLGVPWLVATFGERPPEQVALGYALVVLAVSYLLGVVSYHALEKPCLRLRRFFEAGGWTTAIS
jgi:peptidoglycan/LPS O-acetylase OafA/YrhL